MKEKAEFVIYALIDPRDRMIFYVGQTRDLNQRYQDHCNASDDDRSPRAKRIREILATGKRPYTIVLERCSNRLKALAIEIFWIMLLKGRGIKLTNRESQAWLADQYDDLVAEVVTTAKRKKQPPTAKPANAGKTWTAKEESKLERAYRQEKDIATIAKAHHRSEKAIKMKLESLGLL